MIPNEKSPARRPRCGWFAFAMLGLCAAAEIAVGVWCLPDPHGPRWLPFIAAAALVAVMVREFRE